MDTMETEAVRECSNALTDCCLSKSLLGNDKGFISDGTIYVIYIGVWSNMRSGGYGNMKNMNATQKKDDSNGENINKPELPLTLNKMSHVSQSLDCS